MGTSLVQAMEALGLSGEVSQSGRWVRLASKQGLYYVVEAAWGGGYFAFHEPPTAVEQEIYLDPVEAIQAGFRDELHQ
jgi:hypothetical protein